jgi:hypothetical protein
MFFQICFLCTGILAIVAWIWFMACMNSDMSYNIGLCFKWLFATGRATERFWTNLVKLQQKYLIHQNLLQRFDSFIVNFNNMFFQIWFLCTGILAIAAWIWFFACMNSDMFGKRVFSLKYFIARETTIRVGPIFDPLKWK